MNKHTARRGFTITELVIVIVVIAILAAVLIPTFVGLINKANQSADVQAARQMDTALQAESAAKKPASLEEVIDILSAAGFDAEGSLKPVTKNHKFYWYKTFNAIILADHTDAAAAVVVYPAKNEELSAAFAADLLETGDAQVLFDLEVGFMQFVEIEVETGDDAVAALGKGQSITLTEDVTITGEVKVPKNKEVTIDLNGKTLTTTATSEGNTDAMRHEYAIDNEGTIIIENGTFEARGIENRGKMIIKENVVVKAVDYNGGAAIWNYSGGEVVVEGGTFMAVAGDKSSNNPGPEPGVINNSGKITINGGTFTAPNSACYAINNYGEMVINGGDFSAYRGVIASCNGTVTVNNGKFAVTSNAGGYAVYTEGSGKVIINGGQFTSQGGMFSGSGITDNR